MGEWSKKKNIWGKKFKHTKKNEKENAQPFYNTPPPFACYVNRPSLSFAHVSLSASFERLVFNFLSLAIAKGRKQQKKNLEKKKKKKIEIVESEPKERKKERKKTNNLYEEMENATWNFVIAGPPFVKIISERFKNHQSYFSCVCKRE